ncbi:MAG: ABC transporter ATP-binding protein [Ilumatobacteraceae bacterium]
MAAVRLDGVTKRFGSTVAVDGVSLDIADGEFMVLLGPSGCGKSTVLRMIAGLETPSEGTVSIGGVVVNDVEPVDRDVAMVFQSYALYPHKTVRANIEFPLKVKGVDKRVRAEAADGAAAMLGLTPYLSRKPAALSGGQRQRVALARAIVRDPAVFCMDEPLSNLDAKLRGETRAELTSLHDRLGATFVYVTHDQVEAMTMGTRIALLADGVLQQVGTPTEVYDRPSTVFVASFLGTPPMNLFPPGTLEPAAHLVGVRPEHITIGPDGRLPARVVLVEHLGHEAHVICTIGEDQRVVVRMAEGEDVPRVGDEVRLDAWAHRRHHFDPVTGRRLPV